MQTVIDQPQYNERYDEEGVEDQGETDIAPMMRETFCFGWRHKT